MQLHTSLGASGITPSSIDYAAGEIRVKGLGVSAEQVAQAAAPLKRQGLYASALGDSLVISAKPTP